MNNGEQKKGSKGKTWLLMLVKLVITVTLVSYLFAQADWPKVVQVLERTGVPLILFVFVLMMLSVTISAYKWQLLLLIHGASIRLASLHRYYFIAVFFNNFLPSSIGGDGYRIYKTLENDRSRSSAVISVIMERLTGIAALLILGYISAVVIYMRNGDQFSGSITYAGAFGLMIGIPFTLFLFNKKVLMRILHAKKTPRMLKIVAEHFIDYQEYPYKSLYVILVSFIFQIHNSMAFFVLLYYGADVPVSIFQLFVILTVMNLAAVLPISINGIGVMDGSFIYVAGLYGVSYDDAFVVMLITRVLLIPISLIGAYLYFAGKHGEEHKKAQVDKVRLK